MQLDMPFLTFNDDPELSLKAQQAIEQGFAQTAGGSAMVILFHPEDPNSVFEKENSELVISSRGAPVHVYNVSALEVLATADKRTDSTIVHVFAQGCHDWTAFDDLFNSGVHNPNGRIVQAIVNEFLPHTDLSSITVTMLSVGSTDADGPGGLAPLSIRQSLYRNSDSNFDFDAQEEYMARRDRKYPSYTCDDRQWLDNDFRSCLTYGQKVWCSSGQVQSPHRVAAHEFDDTNAGQACCVCGGGILTNPLQQTVSHATLSLPAGMHTIFMIDTTRSISDLPRYPPLPTIAGVSPNIWGDLSGR
jgi:hypothetical protein